MLDSSNELLTFAVICKTLSITQAAKELKKSKAHVSRQLLNLEKRIGTTLVYRTTRNLTLTEHGLALKNDAILLLNASQSLDYKAATLSSDISGRFCITIPTSIASSIFPQMLLGLRETFPRVSFEILVSNGLEPLLDKKIDLGIRLGAMNENLVAHKVGAYQTVFVSSDKEDELKRVEDLTLIVDSFPSKANLYVKNIDDNVFIDSFRDRVYVNETATQLSFIQSGLGVGLVPSFVLSGVAHSNLFRILPEYGSYLVDVYVTYPYQTPLPNKLSSISEFLKQELKKYMMN